MRVIGADILRQLQAGELHDAKAVLNAQGAVVFPSGQQHRDITAEGVSYEDDYRGNALAATFKRDAIEIRFHGSYTDAQVAAIVRELLAHPDVKGFTPSHVTYQGRSVAV